MIEGEPAYRAPTFLQHGNDRVTPRIQAPLWPHLWMALYGAGWAAAIDVGVRLYIAEIVAIVGLVFVARGSILKKYPVAVSIIGSYGLLIVAILVSDTQNSTAPFDTARNIASPFLGGISLIFVLSAVSRNHNSILSYLFAMALAKGVLGDPAYGDFFADWSFSLESLFQDTNYFKVRIEPFLSPALLLVACLLGRRNLAYPAMLFMATAVGYFFVDYRSVAAVFFVSAISLLAFKFRIRPKLELIPAALVAALILYAGLVAYVDYTLTNNAGGHNGQQLARMENPYNPVELLNQGRSEWSVMPTAISERPVFGWGSWARDTEFRFIEKRAQLSGSDVDIFSLEETGDNYIPAHSLVGTAWLWSGLLGFIAAMWLARSLILLGLRLFSVKSTLLPAATFLLLMLFWHFFFSPPQHLRLTFPAGLAALIVVARLPSNQVRVPRPAQLPQGH
jgi:hypothetical protein